MSQFYHPQGPFPLGNLLEKIGIHVPDKKLADLSIKNINSLTKAQAGELSFLYSKKKLSDLNTTQASICLVSEGLVDASQFPSVIQVPNAHIAQAKIAQIFYPNFRDFLFTSGKNTVHPTAQVHPSAQLGAGVVIGAHTKVGPHTIIGDGVTIGEYGHIHGNATISCAVIGGQVTIYPGAVIGQMGFGFAIDKDQFIDIPHLGRVVIQDHVRIGANTTIDRGVLDDTVIGAWCRIDNLVQIAHNVVLGPQCVVASQTGIAGSTVIGAGSMFGGQVGVIDHLTLGKGVRIAAQSGISKDLEDGAIVGGSPAVPIREWHKQVLILNRLVKKREI